MNRVKNHLFWQLFKKYLIICTLIAIPLAVFIQLVIINGLNNQSNTALAIDVGSGGQPNAPSADNTASNQTGTSGQDVTNVDPATISNVGPGEQLNPPTPTDPYAPTGDGSPDVGPGAQLNPPQPPSPDVGPGVQENNPQPPIVDVGPGPQLNPPQPPVVITKPAPVIVSQPAPVVVQRPQPIVVNQPAPVVVQTQPVVQKVVSPPVCAETPTQYPQCGGTCNGIPYPADHTVMVTKNVDSACHVTFQCADLGARVGECGNHAAQVSVSTPQEVVSQPAPAQPIQVAIQPQFQQPQQSQQQSQVQSQTVSVQSVPAPVNNPTVTVTSVTRTTTPVVTTVTKTVPSEQLPQTGPAAAGLLVTGLIPLGIKLRRIKSSQIDAISANTVWQDRELKR